MKIRKAEKNWHLRSGKHEPEAFHCTAAGGKKQNLLSSEEKSGCDQYRRMWISLNPEEAALLQTEKYQRKVAEAVADGIVTYLKNRRKTKIIEKNVNSLFIGR